jgi:hypothetical protein
MQEETKVSEERIEKLEDELARLNYHLYLLARGIPSSVIDPLVYLIISFKWSEEDYEDLMDTFEYYSRKLEENKKFSIDEFQQSLDELLSVDYQEIKLIICALFDAMRWLDVCIYYACNNHCSEFESRMRDVPKYQEGKYHNRDMHLSAKQETKPTEAVNS